MYLYSFFLFISFYGIFIIIALVFVSVAVKKGLFFKFKFEPESLDLNNWIYL